MEAIPKGWFSPDFSVMEGKQKITDLNISRWREKGQFRVEGVGFEVYREGRMRRKFILSAAGSALATAEKLSVFRSLFSIKHADRHYTLRPKSMISRAMVVLQGSREIGSVSRQGFFTRRANVSLPEDIPLPVKVFIIWLTVILWRRRKRRNSS